MTDVPKIVKSRLGAGSLSGPHLDADQLTAFSESLLTSGERMNVIRHLSTCPDCRDVLAFSLPNLESRSLVEPIVKTSAGWGWRQLRWLALASCTVVAGIGLTLYHRGESARPAEVAHTRLEIRGANSVVPADAPAADLEASLNKPAKVRDFSHFSEKRTGGLSSSNVSPSDAKTRGGAKRSLDTAAPAPARPPAAMQSAFAPSANADAGMMASKMSVSTLPRWTLTPDGTLQRSLDSGKTWETISVAPNVIFRAVSATGKHIWVGGAAGALYRSTDAGRNWTQIKPSSGDATLISDVNGIQFTDAMHGQIMTGSETWTTPDGGETWVKK